MCMQRDLTSSTIAAFGTLLVYDVLFVTYEEEVTLVWPSRWNIIKVLFFVNRYLPFVDTFLSVHLLTGKNTDQECLFGFKAVTWLIVVGIIFSETILMIRTAALWENSRTIVSTLVVLGLGLFIPAIVIVQLEVDSFAYKATATGCTKTLPSSPIIFIAFLLLIASETVIFTLTMVRAWRHHRQTKSALLSRMYKDGLFYYVYLLAFSVVNLIIAVAAPPNFANWLTTPQRVTHSILCTRVLLHIRVYNFKPDSTIPDTHASISFASADGTHDNVQSSTSGSGTTSSGSDSRTGAYLSFQTHTSTTKSHDDTDLENDAIELQDRLGVSPEAGALSNTQRALVPSSRGKSRSRTGGHEVTTVSFGSAISGSEVGTGRGRGESVGQSSRSTM